jgi:hypothetical protein
MRNDSGTSDGCPFPDMPTSRNRIGTSSPWFGRSGFSGRVPRRKRERAPSAAGPSPPCALDSDGVSDVATAVCIRQATLPLAKERARVLRCRRARPGRPAEVPRRSTRCMRCIGTTFVALYPPTNMSSTPSLSQCAIRGGEVTGIAGRSHEAPSTQMGSDPPCPDRRELAMQCPRCRTHTVAGRGVRPACPWAVTGAAASNAVERRGRAARQPA